MDGFPERHHRLGRCGGGRLPWICGYYGNWQREGIVERSSVCKKQKQAEQPKKVLRSREQRVVFGVLLGRLECLECLEC